MCFSSKSKERKEKKKRHFRHFKLDTMISDSKYFFHGVFQKFPPALGSAVQNLVFKCLLPMGK